MELKSPTGPKVIRWMVIPCGRDRELREDLEWIRQKAEGDAKTLQNAVDRRPSSVHNLPQAEKALSLPGMGASPSETHGRLSQG